MGLRPRQRIVKILEFFHLGSFGVDKRWPNNRLFFPPFSLIALKNCFVNEFPDFFGPFQRREVSPEQLNVRNYRGGIDSCQAQKARLEHSREFSTTEKTYQCTSISFEASTVTYLPPSRHRLMRIVGLLENLFESYLVSGHNPETKSSFPLYCVISINAGF